jgi:hypothetical protein
VSGLNYVPDEHHPGQSLGSLTGLYRTIVHLIEKNKRVSATGQLFIPELQTIMMKCIAHPGVA